MRCIGITATDGKNSKAVNGKMVSRYTLCTVESRCCRFQRTAQYLRRNTVRAVKSSTVCARKNWAVRYNIVLLPALPNQEDETDRKKHAKQNLNMLLLAK